MKASINIEYFETLDHWSWEVRCFGNRPKGAVITYGVEYDHDAAFGAAESALEDMMREVVD